MRRRLFAAVSAAAVWVLALTYSTLVGAATSCDWVVVDYYWDDNTQQYEPYYEYVCWEDPPSSDPPTEDPPTEDPPTEDPPTEEPPIEDPPIDPPTGDPPSSDPPDGEPPWVIQGPGGTVMCITWPCPGDGGATEPPWVIQGPGGPWICVSGVCVPFEGPGSSCDVAMYTDAWEDDEGHVYAVSAIGPVGPTGPETGCSGEEKYFLHLSLTGPDGTQTAASVSNELGGASLTLSLAVDVDFDTGGEYIAVAEGEAGDDLIRFFYQSDEIHVDVPACGGDERGNIIKEYRSYNVGVVPRCSDFASGGGSANFSWSELNHAPGSGHPPWGIVRIWSELEGTRAAHEGVPITVHSGYRCPHGNAQVGGAPESRHQYGDAVDISTANWSFDEWNDLRIDALASGFTWFEPYMQDPSHLHVDRR